jgi:predicted DNA-binding transcriptional regulator YafY
MDNVKVLDEPRDGKEVISSIKIADFAQTHFSMFSGDEYRVHMVFENSLLDTVVEQFGTKNVFYISTDDNHFEVSTNVGVSSQFFSWITGFGKRARITEPAEVVKQYTDYLDEIRSSY